MPFKTIEVSQKTECPGMENTKKATEALGLAVTEPFALLGKIEITERTLGEVQAHFSGVVSVVDAYPCTPLQEGLMALSMKQNRKFVLQKIFKLPVKLDLEKFQTSWQKTVDSSAILRTRLIQTRSAGLVQVVCEREQIEWQVSENLAAYLSDDRQKFLGLGTSLFCYGIVNDAVSRSKYFVWTFHHALFDGWSMRLLLKQVDQAYRGDKLSPLVNFNEFIAYLCKLDHKAVQHFWRQQLANTAAAHFPFPPSPNYLPLANSSLKIQIQVSNQLATIATMSTIIQAAWSILIGRYTNTNDVVFGVVLAGRNLAVSNIKLISGPTFTTVPMRVILDSTKSVIEFLETIRTQKSAMKPYQHAGLQNIRRLGEDARTACDFQNLLVIQPRLEEDPESLFGGSDKVSDYMANLNAYSLMLQCDIIAKGFTVTASFNTNAIPEKQMQRILHQLENVVMQLSLQVEGQLGDIEVLTQEDRHEIQTRDCTVDEVRLCVHDLINQSSCRQLNAPAICSWDGELTYGQLDMLSLRLAHRLKSSKVGPEIMVALLFEKSLWMAVAMMAVMKAGGVFVPLDPNHPRDRVQSLIREVGGILLLCSRKYFESFSGISDETIAIDESALEQFPVLDGPACRDVKPENAVYVIFTSGSTGKPKGCVLEHTACCSSMIQLAKSLGMDSSTRTLQFSSYSFDACIVEILTTLIVGGCVCIPSEEERLNDLVAVINNLQVNCAFLTPTFSRLIQPDAVRGLKTLSMGGEKVAPEDIDRWAGRLRLFNCYGPTECCISCIVNEIKSKDNKASIIGQGIIGTFLVLDDANRIALMGTVGELYIGGPNLARGYFNDHEKTAAAFLNGSSLVPQLNTTCKRFYRTGDLVKYEFDGTLDYQGRKDTQIKIRGQRIELGEVEHHIRQKLDGLIDVAVEVITPTNAPQNPLLTAFICLEDGLRGTEDVEDNPLLVDIPSFPSIIARLSVKLSTSLPRYMIPSVYLPLKTMPHSTSGKTDRGKLRLMATKLSIEELFAYVGEKQEKTAPRTDREQIIRDQWAKTLNMAPSLIGIDDNFIRLGGDSILAMILVAALHNEDLLLTVADVFQNPILSEMAMAALDINSAADFDDEELAPFALIGGLMRAEAIFPEVISQCSIAAKLIKDLLPCTPFQEGVMILSIRHVGAYVAQHVFELSSDLKLNLKRFFTAWEGVVVSYPILRTRIIQTESDGLMQVVVDEKISWVLNDDLDGYLREDGKASMKFGEPLARYAICKSTTSEVEKCYFVFTAHHAIYDGWSIPLLLDCVAQEYRKLKPESILSREVRKSMDRPMAFNRFIRALQKLDRNDEEAFWRSRLCDGEPATFPPFRSVYLSRPSASIESEIKFAQKPGSDLTSSTIIRVAWAILIGRYANSNDVVFGVTLSGRTGNIANLDRMIGPTVTTVPLRIVLEPLKSMTNFMREVQMQTLEMSRFEHMGLSNIGRINAKTKAICDFQNLLIIQPRGQSNVDETFLGPRVKSKILTNSGGFDTYALTMECRLTNDGLAATAIFDPQVIDEKQMRWMMHQFQYILQQLCLEESQRKVQDVEIISPEDVQQLWEWNFGVPKTVESCVHHLIKQKTLQDPCAPAICSWDGNLSYGELENLSSRLAHRLITLGVGPEVKVPLFFNKSLWAVVAILAIIKAGGVFVPLDPSHPKKRMGFIFYQIEAKVVLCSAEYANLCSELLPEGKVIMVDNSELAEMPGADDIEHGLSSVEVSPSNALYVIFTSGTTGTPKGAVVEHMAYCSGARDHAPALHFSRTTRFLQFASYSFDTSVEDILTTLLVGGCLCIPSEDERIHDLAGAINRMNVTTADLTPSFISHIMPEEVPTLKILILGGEVLTSRIIKIWANRLRLINGYGTTECCVTSLVNSHITPDTDAANIGFAVGGVCWIVEATDPDRLAPVGTIGELLIEGPTLARGYLNDEAKTQASFIQSPAWARKENESQQRRPGRLYRTGDLARFNADGSISYIGRKDTRVKIRGQRIELDEVEHHLVDHPQVKSAMAVLPNSGPYKSQLAAVVELQHLTYSPKPNDMQVVTKSELEYLGFKWSDLSTYLDDRLPTYMIPTTWIAVKRMPLHTSGKLDRSRMNTWLIRLPAEHEEVEGFKAQGSPPIAAEESIAMEISIKIADLVSNDCIRPGIAGYDVTLSSVGLDSIRISTLVAFIKRSYGVVVKIQRLLRNHTTVRDVSKQISELKAGIGCGADFQLDLMKEFSSLDARLNAIQPVQTMLGTVFITGASGYLGTEILRQLLTLEGVDRVIAHVRAHTVEQGRQRLITSAKLAKWWSDSYAPKLEIWIGDLAKPKIGLKFQQWTHLSTVDAIIHNGASVQWLADYFTLKQANVISTLELLMVTTTSRPQRPKFVYISGGREFGDEVADSEVATRLASVDGYSQTKFVSELLVKQHARRVTNSGHHISIIKPGLIIGTAQEGVANTDDFLWRFVAAAIQIQGFPQPDPDAWLPVASVDRVAGAVIEDLSLPSKPQNEATGGSCITSISDGLDLQEFWDILSIRLKYTLRPMTQAVWMEALQRHLDAERELHPLWPVAPLLRIEGKLLGGKRPKGHIDSEVSEGIKDAVTRNVEFLVEVGFLRGPGGEGEAGGVNGDQGFKRGCQ